MENSFKSTHPDFPWGFYVYRDKVFLVTNTHRAALNSGTSTIDVNTSTGQATINPVAEKKGFKFFDK